MKIEFVVEVINGCCFQHETGEILERFSNKNDALAFAYGLKEKAIKDFEERTTHMRVLDVSNYPPQEIYTAEIEKYLYEYKDTDVPAWIEGESHEN